MRFVRGLASALLLTALLVGIPAALVVIVGNPIPSASVLQNMFSQPDYGGRLLFGSFVPIVAWIAWATFAVSVLVEIPAALRGISAPRIRGLGPQQAFAAALIGAIIVMISAGTLAGAQPAQALERTAATTAAAPQTVTAANTKTNDSQETPAATKQGPVLPSYTVSAGDSLWKIAEQHLGDGSRFKEIAQLNYGAAQPDGATLTEDHWIEPGWTLSLPADAVVKEAPSSTTHTVASGETLTGIAQTQLGDSSRAHEIFDASSRTIQPDGARITDPDLIRPGWQLTVPGSNTTPPVPATPPAPAPIVDPSPAAPIDNGAPAPASVPAAPAAPSVESTAPAETPPQAHVAEQQPAASAPAQDPAGLKGMGIAPTTPASQSPAETPAATTSSAQDQNVDGVEVFDVRTVGGLGAIACAGILSVLGLLRLHQRRRRQPGKRVSMPEGDAAVVELQMRGVEDPMAVEDLDLALKHLAVWAQDNHQPLPQMFSVRIAPDEIALYLAAPAELPAPFVKAETDGSVWTVDVALLEEDLERVPSVPYPALVTLGQDSSNAHILIDLEFLGSLNISGTSTLQAQVLNAMAVEMASSPLGEDLQISLVGIAPGLPAALQTGRVRHIEDTEALLVRLRGKAKATEEAFKALGVRTVEEARAQGADAQAWVPEIVILGSTPEDTVRAELAELVTRIPRLGIAAVTAGDLAGDWTLNVETPNSATLWPIGLNLTPQILNDDEYARILDVISATHEGDTEGPAWARNLDPNEPDLSEVRVEDTSDPASGPRHLEPVPDIEAEPSAVAVDAAEDDEDQRPDQTTDSEAREIEETIVAAEELTEPEDDLPPETAAVVGGILGSESAEDMSPIVCVLGPVTVRNPRGEIPTTAKQAVSSATVARCTALAAFLALNPGASSESFHAAFWPNQDPAGKTASSNRNKLSNQTRNWLGQNDAGEPFLPHAALDGYRLHEAVKTDWDVWLELIGDDLSLTSTTRLAAALKLVRGQPFAGVKESSYAWAEVSRQEMIAAVCDAAHELANRALRHGDAVNGRLAAAKGIMVDPTNEAMWRDAMLAEHVAGDKNGVRRTVERLQAFLTDFEDGYEPEEKTQDLIDSLLGQAVA